jgi:hypothetical protein
MGGRRQVESPLLGDETILDRPVVAATSAETIGVPRVEDLAFLGR